VIFESERDSAAEKEPFNNTDEQNVTWFLLETFIRNGAELQLALKIEDSGQVPHSSDDIWYSYNLKIVPDVGETLVLDVVLNILSRMTVGSYPVQSTKRKDLGSMARKSVGGITEFAHFCEILDQSLSATE